MSDWTAILPLAGVVIGAVMQYWLSRTAELRKQIQLLQAQSYVDYLSAVREAAHAQSLQDAALARAKAADAKARMAVYGAPSVISALARFEETGAALNTAEAEACFVAAVKAMRQGGTIAASDLRLVLLGPKEKLSLLK